ncbi:unnamed protein product [Phytomonas sp. Hart1]|nr:unnamed protein product [Phytomonas sp. Hart1]|eukprot:CCW70620.1 unnamed protein product [Phytomonas sp. isolate Hart1]
MGSSESRTSRKELDFIKVEKPSAAARPESQGPFACAEHLSESNVLLSLPESPIPLSLLRPQRSSLRLLVQSTSLGPLSFDPAKSFQLQGTLSTQPNSPSVNKTNLDEKTLHLNNYQVESASLMGSSAPRSSSFPFQAPQSAYNPHVHFVHERTTFVRTQQTHPPSAYRFTVYAHIYELTDGILAKYGPELIGIDTSGAYHSAIVCYGMEFYFEGGIAIAGAGKTRNGTKYQALRLGSTTVSFTDFLRWVREKEQDTYQIHDYDIKRHNCHHFTSKAAEFLLGKADLVPLYLFSTTNDFFQSERGAALYEAMSVAIRCTQYSTSHQQLQRVMGMQSGLCRLLRCLVNCRIPRQPPKAVIIFHVDNEETCKATLDGLRPYVEQLIDAKLLKPVVRNVLSCLTIELSLGFDSVDIAAVQVFVDVLTEAFLRNPPALWGPLLNALRVSILHHMVLSTVVFHSKLLSVLVFASQEFIHLLPDAKLNLLRVICNLACGSHGAILLSDYHFLGSWVSLVGMGLMEPHSAIVYTASCLAVNITISEMTWIIPLIANGVSRSTMQSKVFSLLTIVLYNLYHRTEKELSEPSFNMLLTCLMWFMMCSTSVSKFILTHPFYPSYINLRQRAKTNESCALLSMLNHLEAYYA